MVLNAGSDVGCLEHGLHRCGRSCSGALPKVAFSLSLPNSLTFPNCFMTVAGPRFYSLVSYQVVISHCARQYK